MTRRSLLLSSLSAATLADIATARQHAASAASSKVTYRYLSVPDAAEIEALTAQIIPSDEHARRPRSRMHSLHRSGP